MKKALVVVLGLAICGLFALAADPPADIKFDTKMGTVTFPHKAHADKGIKCEACHHTTKAGETPQKCEACHDKAAAKDKAPKLSDAVHTTCWQCHEKTVAAGQKSGPVKKDCKVCHVKA